MDEIDDNQPLDLKPEPCGICGDGGHEAWACPNQTQPLTAPMKTDTNKHKELEELLYDVGLTFLPKDCAMVGDILVSPPRSKGMKEDTGKEYAKAVKAVERYIMEEVRAELAKTCLAGMPELTPRQQDYITKRLEQLGGGE